MPAGFRKHCAHFSEGKTGQHGNDHANHPDEEEEERRPSIDGDVLGGKKDAGPDDPARQEQNGIKQGEPADEFSLFRQCKDRARIVA